MKKFNRYFSNILLKNFVVVEAFVYILYMFFMFFTQSKYISRYGATFYDILIYDIVKSPIFIAQTLPVSFIVAVVITFILLIRSVEMTAYVSIGGSLLSLLKILIFYAILVSVILFLLTEFVVPKTQAKSEEFKAKFIEKREFVKVSTLNNFWIKDGDSFIGIGTIDILNKRLFDVKFIDVSKDGKIYFVRYISQADYIGDKKWLIKDYKEVDTKDIPTVVKVETYTKKHYELFTKLVDVTLVLKPKELTFYEIKRIVEFYKSKGLSYSKHLTYLYNKIANILNVIILTIVIIPYLIDLSRSFSYVRASSNGILIVFSFFIIQSSLFSLGKSGVLPPFLSNFSVYIIFSFIGFWGYFKKKKLFYL
jgi:lipopolysaccharide export system permease protein